MDVKMIQIGDDKGIILSASILKMYSINDTVELILEEDFMILKSKTTPRQGWDKAFKEMHKNGDDKLLIDDVFEDEVID